MDYEICMSFVNEYQKLLQSGAKTITNFISGRQILLHNKTCVTLYKNSMKYLKEYVKNNCKNNVEIFTQEPITDFDPSTIIITKNNIGYEITNLCKWIISKKLTNVDPFGNKIWGDEDELKNIINNHLINEEIREKILKCKSYELITNNKEKLIEIGTSAIKLFADNTSSHSNDSNIFKISQKCIEQMSNLLKQNPELEPLSDSTGYTLKEIIGTAHETCIHGVGISLFKLFADNWKKLNDKSKMPDGYVYYDEYPDIFIALRHVVSINSKENGIAILIYNTETMTCCRFHVLDHDINKEDILIGTLIESLDDGYNKRDEEITKMLTEKVENIKAMCIKYIGVDVMEKVNKKTNDELNNDLQNKLEELKKVIRNKSEELKKNKQRGTKKE